MVGVRLISVAMSHANDRNAGGGTSRPLVWAELAVGRTLTQGSPRIW